MSKRPAPRPKRGGEDFARTHHGDGASDSKKALFDTRNPTALAADAPEEDAVLDADVIGRRGAQAKRSAVNIDGYESDSSNEGFDARAEAKGKSGASAAPKSKDEEDDDMFADIEEKQFADGDDDEDLQREGKKRKQVKLANSSSIDGQVNSSRSRSHISAKILSFGARASKPEDYVPGESESESSEDEDEEGRAALDDGMDEELGAGGKKKHAPRLDAFNVRQEMGEGAIDENHNYLRKAADPDAVYDNWLEGTDAKQMRKAKEAHERRDRERRAKDQKDDDILVSEVLRSLIPHIEVAETVMEALARLGPKRPVKSAKIPKWKAKKLQKTEMDVDRTDAKGGSGGGDAVADEDAANAKRRQDVEAITEAADRMLQRGHDDIYDMSRELLIRLYNRETGEEWADSQAARTQSEAENRIESGPETENRKLKYWQYRWADGRDGGEVHGPYDGATMTSWNNAGYFGEGVEFRELGEDGGEIPAAQWSSSVDFA